MVLVAVARTAATVDKAIGHRGGYLFPRHDAWHVVVVRGRRYSSSLLLIPVWSPAGAVLGRCGHGSLVRRGGGVQRWIRRWLLSPPRQVLVAGDALVVVLVVAPAQEGLEDVAHLSEWCGKRNKRGLEAGRPP